MERSTHASVDVFTMAVPRGYIIGPNQSLSHKILGVLPIRTCFLSQRSYDKKVFLALFGGIVLLLFIAIVFATAPSILSDDPKPILDTVSMARGRLAGTLHALTLIPWKKISVSYYTNELTSIQNLEQLYKGIVLFYSQFIENPIKRRILQQFGNDHEKKNQKH